MALEQYLYGAGSIYFIPQGSAIAQPVKVGVCQDISVDHSWGSKPLQGSLDAPVAIARGALKISGKLKAAKFRIADVNATTFGATTSTSITLTAENEGAPSGTAIPAAVSIPTSTLTASGANTLTFAATTGVVVGQTATAAGIPVGTVVQAVTGTTVTLSANTTASIPSATSITFGPSITVANAATFGQDLGVVNVTTGVQLSRVASAPATGQYAVVNGSYTFATADVGGLVVISYTYTKTTGASFTYYAQKMGARPSFQMVLSQPYRGNNPNYAGTPPSMTYYNVGIDKWTLDFKNEDWTIPESDFSVAQDYLGRVFSVGGDSA